MAAISWPASISASRLGSTKSVVPMTTRRRLSGTQPPGLDQLAQDHVALQGGEMIDEQDAVEMVDLVLDAAGEQALRLELALQALLGQVAHLDLLRPCHVREVAGKAQAALLG